MDIDAGFRSVGVPGGECGRFTWASYNFNYAITNIGAAIAAIEFPAETALASDGNLALPGACNFNLFDSPVQARHNDIVNATYADGHAKTFTAKLSGCTGTNINGNALRQYCVTSGAYTRWCGQQPAPDVCRDELWGFAKQDQWGWCTQGAP